MVVQAVRRLTLLSCVVGILCTCASTASAQYFGRNKVQYKNFNFQILKTEHFDIYFYPSAREGIDIAARMAERWHARLERLLEHQLRGRQPLVLYASHPDFEQTNTIQGDLGEGTGGVTEPLRRRIILPMAGPLSDTDHVIGHELVHAFQFDLTTRPGGAPGETTAERLPLWFIEGMAEYLSIGPIDANTAMWLRDAAREEKLPDIDDLNNPRYFPYRWGQAFWAYVGGKWGDEVVGDMFRVAAAAGDPAVSIRRVLGLTTKQFSEEWHAAIRQAYSVVLAESTTPSEVGRPIVQSASLGGDLNVGPALSPDGRWLAFLSERNLFSIDLYVADTATGKVVHKLTSTASDPHFSSLQFIYSSGAWDATSRRIAVATISGGRPALAIFDGARGSREREVKIQELDEIFNPTWSPDGSAVAFTGMSRGLTDLYVVDLATSTLRALTHDAYAELQPSWSPDGKRIAFVTDRFSSDLAALSFGSYRLATVDAAGGEVEAVPGSFASGKHINPQWSPDGRSLFFIADQDGIPNLYRVDVVSGNVAQVTTVGTGLSGITASSPALSIAAKTGVGAVTVYDRGKYHIYALTSDQLAATRAPIVRSVSAALLPPVDRKSSLVASALGRPLEGLPDPKPDDAEPYRSTLKLDAIGQPTIAVGASQFGTSIAGGLSVYFSDMLGNHSLAAAVQVGSGIDSSFNIKNTAAQVAYLNQSRRVNWGLVGGQIPYVSGGIQSSIGSIGGQQVVVDETILLRQTERSGTGLIAYPFNRAHRVEFQGGISQISFDQTTLTQAYSLRTGQLVYEDSQETSVGESLTLGTSSVALVYDTSSFGATSPVQGQRYRLEASPTFGSLNYTTMLADYRRYVMPVPFYTLAGRVLHYGRYGSGSDDARLYPMFIGYPGLVRGYDVNTFSPNECVATVASTCPAFDQLIGTRLLVANLELRFPLLRPFGMTQAMYGPLPVEMALFADAGVAWLDGERPELFGGNRQGVSSVGVAVRANFLGFAVGEFAFSRPLQRPDAGWIFQFNLSPGF